MSDQFLFNPDTLAKLKPEAYPLSALGYTVRVSPLVPKDRVFLFRDDPDRPDLLSEVGAIFRECRRAIYRQCPTIAPEEWKWLRPGRELESLLAPVLKAMAWGRP